MRPTVAPTKRRAGAPKPKKVEKSLLADFGKDKYPRLRASGQANVRTRTEMKTCNELSAVTMTDGGLATIATVQLNSAFEPVDNETEQPRGFDQFTTWYKRFRVSKCSIQAIMCGQMAYNTLATPKPLIIGISGHLSGEAPTSLREAMESPRTVYKVVYPKDYTYADGTPASGYANRPSWNGSIEAVFDCAELFGDRRNYYTSDDVVGYSTSNPAVLLLATVWVAVVNGDSYDDWVVNPVVMTNQKLTWFGPEKLAVS